MRVVSSEGWQVVTLSETRVFQQTGCPVPQPKVNPCLNPFLSLTSTLAHTPNCTPNCRCAGKRSPTPQNGCFPTSDSSHVQEFPGVSNSLGGGHVLQLREWCELHPASDRNLPSLPGANRGRCLEPFKSARCIELRAITPKTRVS